MLINNNYIIERYNYFLSQKQKELRSAKIHDDKLNKIKLSFPVWLRTIIFHPFNPVYSVFLQYKSQKKKKEGYFNLQQLQVTAVDFVQYCFNNKLEFETNLYYPESDESQLRSFIDNRIMSCIPGYTQLPYSQEQLEMLEIRRSLSEKVKSEGNGFSLSWEGKDYFLPVNLFEEPVFIHGYGLNYLPEKVKTYIQGKDFLDVGAYLGDTSIYLQRNYNPKGVYAYEPVKKSAEELRKTIEKNNAEKIFVIEKGIGEKEENLEIHIDPNDFSGSTINTLIADTTIREIKEQIRVTTIDSECKNRNVGLIKMDIEGAEYSAIKGALETIKRDRPVLLISLYHTGKDFFEIPSLLKENVIDYQFRFINIEVVNPFSEKILAGYPKNLD